MCGIAGIIGNYDKSDIILLSEKIKHRGPDGVNTYRGENFCLIHSLLKIMDLSNKSIQPMVDKKNGNVIIFNGAIYNYKNLKKKYFISENFESNTDTEVILKLYAKFGIKFVELLNGMFSISLFDKKLNKLFVIRDPYGIKPLYYYLSKDFFIFASEIKALTSNQHIKNELNLDYNQIIKFIAHRQIHGFKETFFKNIRNLEPGTIITYNLNTNNFKIDKYIINNFNFSKINENRDFAEKFNSSLNDQSITEHSKIACFLSGGIDSTLLSITLNKEARNKEIHTFSALLNKPNDENKNIPKINKDYNFIEHYVSEDSIDFFEAHIKTISDMDQPTADASMVIHNFLCKEVSKSGFKVLFSGLGGDETFFGYPLHVYGYLAYLLKKDGINKFLSSAKNLREYLNDKYIYLRAIKEIININKLNYFKNYQLSKRIKHLDINFNYIESDYYKSLSKNLFNNIILNYNSHWGLSYFLDYEDKNSMAYGIESRVPYLDKNIVNYSNNINLENHFQNGPKSILRNHPHMPKYILNTKKKYGFPGNLEGYLEKNLEKIKEKIFYDFKEIPLINIEKLLNLTKNLELNSHIFFRTYSYGIWYKNFFK